MNIVAVCVMQIRTVVCLRLVTEKFRIMEQVFPRRVIKIGLFLVIGIRIIVVAVGQKIWNSFF